MSLVAFEAYLRASKTILIKKGHLTPCTVCLSRSDGDSHSMKYQLAWCHSAACAEIAEYTSCQWRGKILTCQRTGLVTVFDMNSHATPMPSPKKNTLTRPMRAFVKAMTQQEMKPAVIRNQLIELWNLEASEIPALVPIQNCAANYRRAHMNNSDLIEVIQKLATQYTQSATTSEDEPLAFGFERDACGNPIIGSGSDSDPFIFGITTLRLLRKLSKDPSKFVFHVDATFKLNQSGYPVVVCGMSGTSRSFVPVAFFIASQRTEYVFGRLMHSLSSMYFHATRQRLVLKYVMGDADDAQYNAVMRILGSECDLVYLMCFYHVIAKVAERARSFPRPTRKMIFDHVYNMHFARSQRELESALEQAWTAWATSSQTIAFGQYFYKQWLTGKFMRWQCYHTPTSFATTNNPVEQFNKVIKRDYTLRTRLKVGTLITKLASCCHKHSLIDESPTVSKELKKLKRRMLLMAKCSKIVEAPADMMQLQHIISESVEDGTLQVQSFEFVSKEQCSQLSKKERTKLNATMSVSNARMEFYGMPPSGWRVSTKAQQCPCNYFFKFGVCVHILYACYKRGMKMPWEAKTSKHLVNRTIGKRQRNDYEDDGPQPGRPPTVGFALSFD